MNAANAWPRANAIHLVLSSLGAVLIDAEGVRSVRAQDATGSFGLWPGHENLLALLSVGLLSWRDAQDAFAGFLERLRNVRVLDPACGSGNFLPHRPRRRQSRPPRRS